MYCGIAGGSHIICNHIKYNASHGIVVVIIESANINVLVHNMNGFEELTIACYQLHNCCETEDNDILHGTT